MVSKITGKHRKEERRASGTGRRLWAAAMALALTAALLSPVVSGGFAAAAENSGLTRIRRISEDPDPVTEEEREARVFDDAGLFSDAEEAALQARIASIREKWQIDPVIVTSYAVPDNRSSSSEEKTMAWADDYYDQGGFGLGEDKAGFLYLIDMHNRVSYISTGGVMIDYVSDRRKERLLSNADEFLGEGEYGKAAMAVLQSAEKMMQDGIEEGHFRYDEVTGKRLTGLYNRLTRGEIILAAACGLGAAGLLGGIVGARYGLALDTYKFNKLTQSKVKLSRNDKTFLRQTVTRTRIPQNTGGGRGGGHGGGGSGVHISSGGVSHGGGGHHF